MPTLSCSQRDRRGDVAGAPDAAADPRSLAAPGAAGLVITLYRQRRGPRYVLGVRRGEPGER